MGQAISEGARSQLRQESPPEASEAASGTMAVGKGVGAAEGEAGPTWGCPPHPLSRAPLLHSQLSPQHARGRAVLTLAPQGGPCFAFTQGLVRMCGGG